MSAASCLLTEDQFLCSICQDVFINPVSTPCGHNFCKTCITKHWDKDDECQCPNCEEVFYTRPELQVNTFISETAAQQKASRPGEVSCGNKRAELGKTEAEIQQRIQERRLKLQEMKRSVELSKKDADREIAAGVQVFTALKESVERSQAEFIDTINEKQRETEKQAEGFITELQQEISQLEKRSAEVKKLSGSKDNLFLTFQSSQTLDAAPPIKDWTGVSVRPPSFEGIMVRAVNQLEETLSKQMEKVELTRVQQHAVDLTLDPDTAHLKLILSDDGKQVKHGDVKKNLPDNPERFDTCVYVFAKQSFSSGRFYFEVQVKEKTKWDLGVARESINRKGNIKLAPQNGYWSIWLRSNNQYKALAEPPVSLSLQRRPEKVGVFVDYEEGLVSFYDVDAAALIFSFTGCSFTEKLHPFFSPCLNDGGENSQPLIISAVSHTE